MRLRLQLLRPILEGCRLGRELDLLAAFKLAVSRLQIFQMNVPGNPIYSEMVYHHQHPLRFSAAQIKNCKPCDRSLL